MKRIPLPRIDNCDNCGACCTAQEALPVGYYLGGVGDAKRLPPELVVELEAFRERFDREGWPANGEACVWYDAETRRCKHYKHRPSVCRDAVQVGDDACRAWRRDVGIDPSVRYRLVNGRIVRLLK